MRYFPKSSINILEASLGELVYKNNNEPYVGVYIETDGGKYYEGSDTINLGPELKKPQFVTLTIVNVPARELKLAIEQMNDSLKKIRKNL